MDYCEKLEDLIDYFKNTSEYYPWKISATTSIQSINESYRKHVYFEIIKEYYKICKDSTDKFQ